MSETGEVQLEDKQDIGRFTSFSALMDAHNELLQQKPDLDEKGAYLDNLRNFLSKAQATGALIENSEERFTAQTVLNYWITALHREDIVDIGDASLATYDPNLTVNFDEAQSPYPGVRAFEEDEYKLFFGRQRQLNYILGRLSEDRLLAVVGPSGCGKTSLVLAGVIPELKQGDRAKQIERHYFPAITPGAKPLEALRSMLQSEVPASAGDANQKWDFVGDPGLLLKLIKDITPLPVVVVIDQYQQVFSLANQKDRQAFNRNLQQVIENADVNHVVILTMRAGNYDSYFRRPEEFRKKMDPATVSLPPLSALEIREAIEKPANYFGIKFSEETLKALVDETVSEPTGLPLLQFTLFKLWEAHRRNEDVNEAFAKLTNCHLTLVNSAEEFYKRLELRDQISCKRIFNHLIIVDSELRTISVPATRDQLYQKIERNSRVDALIEKLTSAQLIRFTLGPRPADDEVELTHRSLLRTWPRMAAWVEAKKRKRQWLGYAKRAGIAAVIALVLLSILVLIGRQQRGDKSRELARLSSKQAAYDRFDLALLLGREAYSMEDNAATRSNSLRLLHALQSTSHPKAFFYKKAFEADDLMLSAEDNPKQVAAIDNQGNIVIWSLDKSSMEAPQIMSSVDATYPMAFSSNGKLATATRDRSSVIVWDIGKNQHSYLPRTPRKITNFVFGPDNILITASEDGKVVQWNLADPAGPQPTDLYQSTEIIYSLAWRKKDQLLASGTADGTVVVWDLVAKKRRRTFAISAYAKDRAGRPIASLAFSADSELLAAGSVNEAFIWDLTTGQFWEDYRADSRASSWLLVSLAADGSRLAAFSFRSGPGIRRGLSVWDLTEQSTSSRQFFEPTWAHSAAFSTDGNLLALPREDGIAVWNVFSDRVLHAEGRVNNIAFSPKARLLASSGADNLTLWKAPAAGEYEMAGYPIGPAVGITTLAFSGDGRVLAAGSRNGRISVQDLQDHGKIRVLEVGTRKVITVVADSTGSLPSDYLAEEAPTSQFSVSKVIFDPRADSRRLAAFISYDKPGDSGGEAVHQFKIIIWDTNTEELMDVTNVGYVTSIGFSSDGSTLAWGRINEESDGSGKFTIQLRKSESDVPTLVSEAEVRSLAFSRDGKILAAGLADGKIELWNMKTLRQIRQPLLGFGGEVTDLAFSPDDRIIAAALNKGVRETKSGLIALWDVASGEQVGNPLIGHDGPVSTLAFSCDGKILASASEGFSDIVLWDFDLEGSKERFGRIVDTSQKLPEPAEALRQVSFFENLYIKFLGWVPWEIGSKCCECSS